MWSLYNGSKKVNDFAHYADAAAAWEKAVKPFGGIKRPGKETSHDYEVKWVADEHTGISG